MIGSPMPGNIIDYMTWWGTTTSTITPPNSETMTLAKLDFAMVELKALMSSRQDGITVSAVMADSIRRSAIDTPIQPFAGIAIKENPMFPWESTCSTCKGTGEGTESTYCKKCRGAGATKFVGLVTGEPLMLITEPLPKKFDPSFPTGLVPPMSIK